MPEHSIGLMRARPAMWLGLMLMLLPSLCWSSGVLMAEGKIKKNSRALTPIPRSYVRKPQRALCILTNTTSTKMFTRELTLTAIPFVVFRSQLTVTI